jgi:hypothetical protein
MLVVVGFFVLVVAVLGCHGAERVSNIGFFARADKTTAAAAARDRGGGVVALTGRQLRSCGLLDWHLRFELNIARTAAVVAAAVRIRKE